MNGTSYIHFLCYIYKVAWCRGSIRDFGSRDPSSNLGVTTFLEDCIDWECIEWKTGIKMNNKTFLLCNISLVSSSFLLFCFVFFSLLCLFKIVYKNKLLLFSLFLYFYISSFFLSFFCLFLFFSFLCLFIFIFLLFFSFLVFLLFSIYYKKWRWWASIPLPLPC